MVRALALGFWIAGLSSSPAALTVSPLFGNQAVLQRDKPVPIWGTTEPGAKVTVTFGAQTAETTASSGGDWKVLLNPLPASGEPRDLLIQSGTNTLRSRNVLVGDVWLCAGQSNMNFKVSKSTGGPEAAAAADFPQIRCLKVPAVASASPTTALRSKWDVCTPQTAGSFSAVAFFFGRELHTTLSVPVGLITSSWGGTQIESWIAEHALKKDPDYPNILARWEAYRATIPEETRLHAIRLERLRVAEEKAKAEGVPFTGRPPRPPDGEVGRRTPSQLYNGMIHPLTQAAIRGVIWYQGESNAGRPTEYRSLLPAMIRQWRDAFDQGEIPFLLVQLPNWSRPGDNVAVAYQREAQAAALELPETGLAVTIDVGEANDVHPKNKEDVGKRVAWVALAKTYGQNIPHSGPVFEKAAFEGNLVKLSFRHSGKLTRKTDQPTGFEVAGEDRRFFPAEASLENDRLIVSSPEVAKPVAVRYAFTNAPSATLTDDTHLPAAPFRTDDWPYQPPAEAKEVELP